MAVIAGVINGTNLNRDAHFQAMPSATLSEGVLQNFDNELEVTTNQVDTGMCFVEVTRTSVTPNETFKVPVRITVAETIDTSGTGYVFVKVDQTKVNDGSANDEDGSGIATVEVDTVLPTDPYVLLATLAAGVITDARTWSKIDDYVQKNPVFYDEDTGAADAYAISINGVVEYNDGEEYTFKASTQNTGASTLNINSLGAKDIRRRYNDDLAAADIKAGQIIRVIYDADNDFFQMISMLGEEPASLVLASEAEALAGTNDTKYMSPLKTKYAIDGAMLPSATVGEDIDGTTTPKAVFISPGVGDSDAYPTIIQRNYSGGSDNIYGVYFKTQTFTTGTFQNKLTKFDLLLDKTGGPSGDFQADLYAVDASHKPTGASLGTVTLACSSITGARPKWYSFSPASTIDVSPATEYAIVGRAISGDASNYIEWYDAGGDVYSGGTPADSADAGTSWSVGTNDRCFRVWSYEEQTAGYLYMSHKNEPFRGGVDGFVEDSVLEGESVYFRAEGFQSGFAGLTPNERYYLNSTLGEITTSAGGLYVGYAKSATELMIELQGSYMTMDSIDFAGTYPLAATSTIVDTAIFDFDCGFKPSKAEMWLYLYGPPTGSAELLICNLTYSEGQINGTSLESYGASVTDNSLVDDASSFSITEGRLDNFLWTANGLMIDAEGLNATYSFYSKAKVRLYR